MVIQVSVDLPEETFSALWDSPERFADELRLAAAVKWYELGKISQEKASEIAGLNRVEFLEACSRMKVSPFQTTLEELEREASRE
ncbi:MAG: UPF0175 family protein [Candidatus Omnitrophica bacterium]|nr:UPF0175 family protein [Candidatus Omnitrophota bacterium]MCB9770750.1 UPF0175 family protein [Candidatus Omnitrophota bacterium]MCB9783840.1 UPF0175 family protein [Candidatus Omnitrophota bacterium]